MRLFVDYFLPAARALQTAELNCGAQARLWVQVIQELRSGLKLKKTDYTKTPIEFELTPYEILMDDIRAKRYKLNKVSNHLNFISNHDQFS